MAKPIIAALVVIDRMMFCSTFRRVLLASLMASGIFLMSFDIRIMLPVSLASAEPEMPIEIPISAEANAGASFIPSPIMAVGPSLLNSEMIVTLSSGNSSAWTNSRECPS